MLTISSCILDFSNIVHENYDNYNARIQNYFLVKSQIHSRIPRAKIIPITDARTRHVIDNKKRFEFILKKDKLIQAPKGEQADYYIIMLAERDKNALVFSNDLYEDYIIPEEFYNRLIHFKIIGSIVIFSSRLNKYLNYEKGGEN